MNDDELYKALDTIGITTLSDFTNYLNIVVPRQQAAHLQDDEQEAYEYLDTKKEELLDAIKYLNCEDEDSDEELCRSATSRGTKNQH